MKRKQLSVSREGTRVVIVVETEDTYEAIVLYEDVCLAAQHGRVVFSLAVGEPLEDTP